MANVTPDEKREQILVWVDELDDNLSYGDASLSDLSLVLPVATDAGVYIAADGDMFFMDLDQQVGVQVHEATEIVRLLREQVLNASKGQVARYYAWSQAIIEL